MNYALLVYRCNGDYLYCCEEYETSLEVSSRIAELEECNTDRDFTYTVYANKMTVTIKPPTRATVIIS